MSRRFVAAGLAAAAMLLAATTSYAQTIAGDDFDAGGLDPVSRTLYEGDFEVGVDGVDYELHDEGFNGLFDFGAGSRFDRFGPANSDVADSGGVDLGLPFDMIDQTVAGAGNGAFQDADDNFGILRSTKTDNVFVLADTLNGDNVAGSTALVPDGTVSGVWEFDISAGNQMQISIDFAAIGEFDNNDGAFETDDFFTFTYQIDGGPVETAFDVRPEEINGADTGEFYTVTMESGTVHDRYDFPFFSESDWTTLTTSGPSGGLNFHPDDDGVTNGDTTAQDGFIPVEGALGVVEERANQDGSFNDVEHEAFKDPLVVNSGTASETTLNNVFQTVTTPINGSGSTLTLKLLGVADGSLETFMFDNIVISEAPAGPMVDTEPDGDVDGADFLALQASNPAALGDWQAAYGTGIIAVSTGNVPEPAALALLLVGSALLTGGLARRR